MKLKNKNYDIGKWFVLIFLPSLAVFIGGMGETYGWVSTTQDLVTTINLFTIFLGSILQISSHKYHQQNNLGGSTDD